MEVIDTPSHISWFQTYYYNDPNEMNHFTDTYIFALPASKQI